MFSKFFIDNPRFSGVVAVVMILVGTLCLFILPVSQYPAVTPPQIIVSASYPGVGAASLVDTVAVPIENALNGVEGMLYMSSTADDTGTYQLTITFDIGTDADMAQVKVENRLQQVQALLPDIVIQEGLSVHTQSANILGFLVLESPDKTFDQLYLSNYAYENIQNPLERVSGVSDVTIYGPQYSMRIFMDPVRIASLGLTAQDVVTAIEDQNIQAALGAVGSAPAAARVDVVLNVTAKGLLKTVAAFEEIVLTTDENGGIIRLKDVARIELGADSYNVSARYDKLPSVIIALSQTIGSNALKTMDAVRSAAQGLQQSFPAGMQLRVVYDSTTFVRASIQNILGTLFLTFLLVVGVVFLFLQNIRATFIPALTIPVSLIATFAVIYVIGMDINLLTLFAMILAIGLVVDDAIIVVERVQYLMLRKKMDSYAAAVQAMKDISSSIVATTLVLLAIFIPVGLMAGMTGRIYEQFAVTISAAVVLSAINALTLSPALCALFLKHRRKPIRLHRHKNPFDLFNTGLEKAQNAYLQGVGFLCRHPVVMAMFFLLVVGGIIGLFYKTPTSFLPAEDQGIVFADIQLPQTAGISQTQALLEKMETSVLKRKGIQYVIGIAGASLLGSGGENVATLAIGLKPWDERTEKGLSQAAILASLEKEYADNKTAEINFFALPAIPGVGNSDGLSFQLNALNTHLSADALSAALDRLLTLIRQSSDFETGFSTYTPPTPHVYLDVDREKLKILGVNLSDLFSVLQDNLGSRYVNNITLGGQVNKVIIQADAMHRKNVSDIENLYVRSQNGQMMPIKEFVTVQTRMEPKVIYRYNQYLTAGVSAIVADGVSSGTAIEQVRSFASQLGRSFGISWTGLSLQEVETAGLVFILIALAFVFGYLFLVALYESWLIAFAVILSNVFAILGALIGLTLMQLPLSIYAQLGIVLLIGLASKNAILIVQFTLYYWRNGLDLVSAALRGASERFRAVLMTALTFILGVMPMLFADGAGAASQISMGTSVFFGMLLAVLIGVLFTPALFAFFGQIILKVYSAPFSRPRSDILSVKRRKK